MHWKKHLIIFVPIPFQQYLLAIFGPKIDELECVSNMNNADVLCITESWLSAEISDNYIQLANFNLFRKDRHTRGSGVAIYVKSSIQCKTVYVDDFPDQSYLPSPSSLYR